MLTLKQLRDAEIEFARRSLFGFTQYTMPTFAPNWFHRKYYSYLDRFARGEITKLAIFVPPQHGKLLPADTPVLTTKGFKPHGDLCEGDFVFGEDGKPKRVIRNFGVIDWNVDKIVFNDGNTMLAAREHLWKLHVDRDDHRGRIVEVVETQGIFSKRNRRAPYIQCAPSLSMPDADLPIDPYVLGCWLGDGASRQGVLTVGRQDIEHFSKLGEAREVKPGVYRVLIEGLSKKLRLSNLILNKHIPTQYLLASTEQRLQLLRGLMDTDGGVDYRGNCEFTQKAGRLAVDVHILLRSLGIKSRIATYPMKLNGRVVGEKTRASFVANRTDVVFNLPRKQGKVFQKRTTDRDDKYKYFIKAIEPHGVVKGNCIEVEGGMYLAGTDLVPTHNSEGSTRRLPAYMLGKNPNLKIGLISYSATKARKFNREIQRVITLPEYADAFPDTRLNSSNVVSVSGEWLRNSEEFEIVDHRGSLKSVGVGGPLTGDSIDVLIMDDLYKDAASAWSETIRENVRDWYDTVAQTRLHNESQQLMVFTRWHHDDLGGTEATAENGWVVVKYPALKMSEPSEYDPRETGDALWPEKHSKERMIARQLKNPLVFSALYQQEPTPSKGTIFQESYFTIIADAEWPLEIESYATDWDLAYTEEEKNSACAYVYAGRIANDIFIEDCGFDWLEFPELIKWMKTKRSPHYIEGKASGKSARQTLSSNGVTAIEVPKSTDKITAARLIAPECEAGRVYIRASIASKLLHDERQGLLRFPGGSHNDLLDAFVQAINRLKGDTSFEDLDDLPTAHDTQWERML